MEKRIRAEKALVQSHGFTLNSRGLALSFFSLSFSPEPQQTLPLKLMMPCNSRIFDGKQVS
jgi:hypothetical protein